MPADRVNYPFNERLTTTDGWAKYNRYYWLEGGYPEFLEFFFHRFFPEPHSTKQIEDFITWGLDVDPVTLVTMEDGLFARQRESIRAVCERITVPVLVIHGDEDEMMPHASGAALAEITGGQLVTVSGGGHGVLARDPVIVNHVIKRFVDRICRVRARDPDHEGFVERDGVNVGYELYGEGGTAAFLVPASPITHARSWKGLIPFLSRHVTCRHHRRPRHGPLRPTTPGRSLRTQRDRRRPAGRARRHRRRARPWSWPTVTPRRGRCGSPPSIPSWLPGS